MSTLFAHVSSLFHSVVAAHLSLDELSLVLVVLVILDSYNFLVISWLASSVSAWFRSISHAFLLRFTTSKKTKLPTDPQSRRTSHVSCRIKHQPPAELTTVRVDVTAFQKLMQERHQLHLKVKSSKKNTANLRSHVWFLEDASASLRADITERAKQQEQQASENTALVEEKDALIAERDWIAGDRDRAVQDNESLRADINVLTSSKDALLVDMEDLQAEIEDLIDGKEVLLTDKVVIEEKLARESTKRHQAKSQIEGLQQDRDALESQLALKQETMNDLMDETEALEDDLRSTKRSLKGVQDAMVTLQAAHTDALEEVATLKAELAALRKSTCPMSEVDALRAELQTTKDSLSHLHAAHEQQCSVLTAANDERNSLRDSLEATRGRYHMAQDIQETLLKNLEDNDIEISGLEESLADRDAVIATHEATIFERDAALAERDASLAACETALAEHDVSLAACDIALAERDTALTKADAALAACEASFAALDATTASQDRKIAEMQTYIAGLEGVVRFLKLEASATRTPGTPVKLASTLSQSSLWRSISGSSASQSPTKEAISPPNTPELPVPLMLPSCNSSSSSDSGSPRSISASPRRSWFF